MNYFMDSNNLKQALATIGEIGWKDLNGKKIYFLPVACYAYTVGENTINQSKSSYGIQSNLNKHKEMRLFKPL